MTSRWKGQTRITNATYLERPFLRRSIERDRYRAGNIQSREPDAGGIAAKGNPRCRRALRSNDHVPRSYRVLQVGSPAQVHAELECTDALCLLPSPHLFRKNVRVTRKFSNDQLRRGTFMSQKLKATVMIPRVDFLRNFSRASDHRSANGAFDRRSNIAIKVNIIPSICSPRACESDSCVLERAKRATARVECPRVSEDIEPFGVARTGHSVNCVNVDSAGSICIWRICYLSLRMLRKRAKASRRYALIK
jgi:hypothetical protein